MILQTIACLLLLRIQDGSTVAVGSPTQDATVESIAFDFTTENGWKYDGKLEVPRARDRNGHAVMLLGGALGGPIDWEVPGILTLDGKPTRDGDLIARALLTEGFIVGRWHAIRRGDPEYAKDPLLMDSPSLASSVEQAKLAFDALAKQQLVPVRRTFLVGHSLGAYRSTILLEAHPQIAGIVMLAGASVVRANQTKAKAIWNDSQNRECAEEPDWDQRHELALARYASTEGKWLIGDSSSKNQSGYKWGCDVIAERGTPTLYLVGSLDERWLIEAYMLTHLMRKASHPDYSWKVFENLGHNLGTELAGDVIHETFGVVARSRTGPIFPDVLDVLVAWLKKRASNERLGE